MTTKIILILFLFISSTLCISFECNKKVYTRDLSKVCDYSQSVFDLLKQCMGDKVTKCSDEADIIIPKDFCDIPKRVKLEVCMMKMNRNALLCTAKKCLDKVETFNNM